MIRKPRPRSTEWNAIGLATRLVIESLRSKRFGRGLGRKAAASMTSAHRSQKIVVSGTALPASSRCHRPIA